MLSHNSIKVLRLLGGLLVVGIIVGVPVAWLNYRTGHFRNFRTVKEGVLYRSGQMSVAGLKRAIYEHGIRTVVTLRDADKPGEPAPDLAEEEFCRKEELYHYRITPRAWQAADGSAPARIGVAKFCDIMRDPRHYPVLLHCFAGVHRTGAYVAVYRMEFESWTNNQALAELRRLGYDNLDSEDDVRGFLQQYGRGQTESPVIIPASFERNNH